MEEHRDTEETAAGNGSDNASMAPVLAASEARVIEPVQQPAVPAPVVAAAGGAVVGAAAYVLLRVLKRAPRRAVLRMRKRRRGGFEITGSRSFLVDGHMLKGWAANARGRRREMRRKAGRPIPAAARGAG